MRRVFITRSNVTHRRSSISEGVEPTGTKTKVPVEVFAVAAVPLSQTPSQAMVGEEVKLAKEALKVQVHFRSSRLI